MEPHVEVLRLGHRPGRDDRLTTHVGLTARAFGADVVRFAAEDARPVETALEVTERFGGAFDAATAEAPRALVDDWSGPTVHLTMYGLRVQDEIEVIRDGVESDDADGATDGVLVVVGSEKVPGWVYGAVDHNVGVTNQPHSEVAALAVFLHELYGGEELDAAFPGGALEIVPSRCGKETRELE